MIRYLILIFCFSCSLQALELPRIFSDNMILQANRKLKIWGTAEPAEKISVSLAGKNYSATADDKGAWQVETDSFEYGGPHELTVRGKTGSKTIRNVLFGEVWLGSGQSNMQMALKPALDSAREIASPEDPELRFFTVKPAASITAVPDIQGSWLSASPSTSGNFSAAGYYFAKDLRKNLKVPVGIIISSWGGTGIEAWMSPDTLKSLPETAAKYAELQRAVPVVEKSPRNLDIDDSGWMKDELPAGEWKTISRRIHWDYELYPIEYDGVIWARKEVELPADWAGKDATLSLGTVDDYETTYFNGEEVGGTSKHTLARRVYEIPARLVRSGKNTIAVKTFKIGWGGMTGPENVMFLQLKGTGGKVPVGGEWLYRASKLEFKGISPRLPGVLYNAMIAPLAGYGIRGVIWYQGEANAYVPAARDYRKMFGAMIGDWRRVFGQGEFPFYYVQLAGFRNRSGEGWPLLREAQRRALEVPGTGMAVAIDIGDAGDIHPRNKADVGKRLALWALADTYGKKLTPSGPLYREMKIEGGGIRVYFDYADGLHSKDGSLRHFEIAGGDGEFHPADAEISGGTVLVSGQAVSAPVAVRYGWLDYPENPDLYNSAGLPASPFTSE